MSPIENWAYNPISPKVDFYYILSSIVAGGYLHNIFLIYVLRYMKISLPALHVSFIPSKNPILSLLKNSVHRNRNFSNRKFRFLETKVEFQGKKKSGL
jgi:hypothetical protein